MNFDDVKANMEKWSKELDHLALTEVSSDTIETTSSTYLGKFQTQIKHMKRLQSALLLNKSSRFEKKFLNIRDIFCKELKFNNQDEGTIRLKLKNISKYAETKERREFNTHKICYIKNMPFKLAIYFNPDSQSKEIFLEVYLESLFNSKFKLWSFTIVSCDLYIMKNSYFDDKRYKHSFSFSTKDSNSRGFSKFISIKELLKKDNGYYNLEQDSVTLHAFVKVATSYY